VNWVRNGVKFAIARQNSNQNMELNTKKEIPKKQSKPHYQKIKTSRPLVNEILSGVPFAFLIHSQSYNFCGSTAVVCQPMHPPK
jgi:hypothetical protein